MPKEVRVCKGVGCENTFMAYASQNKKYCTPKCRYSDPAIATLMGTNIRNRHNLSGIDETNKTATCSACGSVVIRERKDKRVFSSEKKWRCRTAEKSRAWAYKYGLSFDAIQVLLDEQGGTCAICPKSFDSDFVVDHCHNTGKVRGLLCTQCNTGIGMLQDDPKILMDAAAYVRKHKV